MSATAEWQGRASLPAEALYDLEEGDNDGNNEEEEDLLTEYLSLSLATTRLRVEVRILDQISGRAATLFSSECLEDRTVDISSVGPGRFRVRTGTLPLADARFSVSFSFTAALERGNTGADAQALAQRKEGGGESLPCTATPMDGAMDEYDCVPARPLVTVSDFRVEGAVEDASVRRPDMKATRVAHQLITSLAWNK
jgi:hypothetical protein